MSLSAIDLRLLDRNQRDFPLAGRPFAIAGQVVGLNEVETIAAFKRFQDEQVLCRIGALVRPQTVGASTLAAIQVPPTRIDEVAAIVNDEAGVNHNYQREHAYNIWFVVTAPDAAAVAATLDRISLRTGLPVLDLPMLQAYHLDLGFPLIGDAGAPRGLPIATSDYLPDDCDRAILARIEDGLPLVPRPYQELAHSLQLDEGEVIERLEWLCDAGVVTRFGCVVRHRALGYVANAMAVWDVPDGVVDFVAASFIANPRVTLCYRRSRQIPDWPYNLFCMIHAKSREEALAVIDDLNAVAETGFYNRAVLFSTRCFKQRAAAYSRDPGEAVR
jgi:DNA-binding Lrp family transcriptional regulator